MSADKPAIRYASYTLKAAMMAVNGISWLAKRDTNKAKEHAGDHKAEQIARYKANPEFREALKEQGFSDISEASMLFETEGLKRGSEIYPGLLKRTGIPELINDFKTVMAGQAQETAIEHEGPALGTSTNRTKEGHRHGR